MKEAKEDVNKKLDEVLEKANEKEKKPRKPRVIKDIKSKEQVLCPTCGNMIFPFAKPRVTTFNEDGTIAKEWRFCNVEQMKFFIRYQQN